MIEKKNIRKIRSGRGGDRGGLGKRQKNESMLSFSKRKKMRMFMRAR